MTDVTDPEPLDMLRQLLAKRVKTEAPTPECLDDDTIAALAEGSLDAAARQAVLPHVAGCARCRGAVASVARALSDSAVAREVASVESGRRRRFYKVSGIPGPPRRASGHR